MTHFSWKTDKNHLLSAYRIYTVLIICCLLFLSCSHLSLSAGPPPDSIPLYTEEIFPPPVAGKALQETESLTGKKTTEKEILEIVKAITKEHSLYFYSGSSPDADFQKLKKEVSVIRAAASYARLSLDIIEKNTASARYSEKELVFLATVKQLLIAAVKNSPPLAVKIEKLIQEKEWEDEGEYSGSSGQFFDIMELDAEIPYLKKTRQELYSTSEKIERFISTVTPLSYTLPS